MFSPFGCRAQLIDQFANGESCGTRARYGVRRDLLELTLTLISRAVEFLVADEGAGSLVSFEQAIVFEFAVGANDSVGIDFKVDRELADSGELIAGAEIACCNRSADLVDDLAIYRNSAMHVEMEAERGFGAGVHVYYITSTPTHLRSQ